MQAFFQFLIDHFLKLWPVVRVYSWQQGLHVRGGKIKGEKGEGLHLICPLYDEVFKTVTTMQAYDLPSAAVTTKDGTSIVVSANICYRVVSIHKFWTTTWDAFNTVTKCAIGEIATMCANETWLYLRDNRATFEESMVPRLNERCKDWGIVVVHLNLTDLVQAKQHRHYLDGVRGI